MGEMMPGRKSSIPNSSESSTSGSFFTSIPTPASTATTIDTTLPKLSTEPRFCVEVDTSDTLWRIYGRSTDFPVQTVKPKRTRYVYHPAPPRTYFHEACKAVRGRIGPTLRDSDAAGRVRGKSWVKEGLLLLASRDVGVQMRDVYQFKRSRSPMVAQVRWRSDNTEASNREGGMFIFVCSRRSCDKRSMRKEATRQCSYAPAGCQTLPHIAIKTVGLHSRGG